MRSIAQGLAEHGGTLAIGEHVPLASFDARDRLSVRDALLMVLDRALARALRDGARRVGRQRMRYGKGGSMRGELDDALNRMARLEELQRRRAVEAVSDDRSPVDEVIEAVRRVVAQHPTLRVALWAEDGTTGAGVRVEWSDGTVTVRLDDGPDGAPPATAPSPASGTAGRPAGGTTGSPAEDAPAAGFMPSLARAVPLPAGVRPPVREVPPVRELPSAGGSPESWPGAVPAVTSWSGAPESDTNESAARLAELIRQDPSLLRAPDDPYSPE